MQIFVQNETQPCFENIYLHNKQPVEKLRWWIWTSIQFTFNPVSQSQYIYIFYDKVTDWQNPLESYISIYDGNGRASVFYTFFWIEFSQIIVAKLFLSPSHSLGLFLCCF